MALTKVYRAKWAVDDGEIQTGSDQTTESAAETDLTNAESAAGTYTKFWGAIEVVWIGA